MAIVKLTSRWDGQFYSTTVELHPGLEPSVYITGPFDSEEAAVGSRKRWPENTIEFTAFLSESVREGIRALVMRSWLRGELNEAVTPRIIGEPIH